MLAIDTPETKHPSIGEEPWGKEASNFTCEKLKKAKKIEIEYDPNSDKTDKYDRILGWIWVDDQLLQDLIIKEGYAEVAYLYNDYKYTLLLQDHEEIAKANKDYLKSQGLFKSILVNLKQIISKEDDKSEPDIEFE